MAQSSLELTREHVIRVVEAAFTDMVEHYMSSPDIEVVGAVHLDGSVTSLVNEHTDPSRHFSVQADQIARTISHDSPDVVAIYHSHPGGIEYPSNQDEKGLAPFPAVILTPTTAILWWWYQMPGTPGFYYRIWDRHYGVE